MGQIERFSRLPRVLVGVSANAADQIGVVQKPPGFGGDLAPVS